ncbi:MAG: DNA repair protein RadC, partial [Bacteroidales bacterium]|jgi:DNA repair protein RadC|nr:DNA repair protein RadC [Bacteroidales bacterium]
MKMKDFLPEDRPRERLLLSGAGTLSNSELLAIVIGSGTGGKNVYQLAQELLAEYEGRLGMLSALPLERLMQVKGIGQTKAIIIKAALELGRRVMEEDNHIKDNPITSPELVKQLMLPTFQNLPHEECWVLFLNGKSRLIGKERLSVGNLERTVLDTRKVLRRAIEKQSRHVILVHNHPEGTAEPSQADIRQTDILRKALSAVEITLLDHIIVAGNTFFSFAQERYG